MSRVEDWPLRLAHWEVRARRAAFVWGAWDCCLAAATWIEAARGFDPAASFRGRYAAAEEARSLMSEFAGGGVLETAHMIARQFGFPEIPILRAQRGDVAVMTTTLGPTLGVCTGAHVILPALVGAVTLPLRQAHAAWRI